MPSLFNLNILRLKGVGEKRALLYQKLGVISVGDLMQFYPRDYEDWSETTAIADTILNEVCTVKGVILQKPREQRLHGGMLLYKTEITDGSHTMQLTFFNNRYIPSMLKADNTYYFRGKVGGTFTQREMASPDFLPDGKTQKFVAIYPQTKGLTSRMISSAVKNAIDLLPEQIRDPLPEKMRAVYDLCDLSFALQKIHFPSSKQEVAIAKNRLIFEELLVLQLGLHEIRERRTVKNMHPIKNEFPEDYSALLPYRLTNAQHRAVTEALTDMSGPDTMNRLIQGDVGSGKTAIAAGLCWCVIKQNMQAALMAPTEILANQHFISISKTLAPLGVRTALLTSSVKGKKRTAVLEALAAKEIDLIIGTHSLIGEQVTFSDLGLVITDEQHRFGVNQRSVFMSKGNAPHLLVMSATPIPRTLALMLYGDLDLSILDELPPGRQPIATYLIDSSKRMRAFRYMSQFVLNGRQAYLICPQVDNDQNDIASVMSYAESVKVIFPNLNVSALHGKMKQSEKETIMQDFSKGEIHILVATTVVEVGVDVPNAVIMIIENADRYGLSQLHQLRGRIGRGRHKSTCILVSDTQQEHTLSRLKTFCSTNDGFKIADADLKLRGPGDFFGARQHGLPQLKLADLMQNMDILLDAQRCAKEIVDSGSLYDVEFEPLRAEIRRLFAKNGEDTLVL